MKRTCLYLVTLSSLCLWLQLDATDAFLTSEKKYETGVTLGTNEDIFLSDTTGIVITSEVRTKVKIVKTKKKAQAGQQGGGEEQQVSSQTFYRRGSKSILFIPQRPHLELGPENFTVTGQAAGQVEVVREETDKDGFAFRIWHKEDALEKRNSTVQGELHVKALGGFYSLTIPITIKTKYDVDTDVSEVEAPPDAAEGGSGGGNNGGNQPGTPPPAGQTPPDIETPPPASGTPPEPSTPVPPDAAPPGPTTPAPPDPAQPPGDSVPPVSPADSQKGGNGENS